MRETGDRGVGRGASSSRRSEPRRPRRTPTDRPACSGRLPPSLPAGIISGASDPLAAVNDEVNEEEAAGPHQAAKQGGRSCHARTASCGPGAGLLRRRCTRAPGKTPGRARTFSECPRKRTGNNGRPEKVNERGADLFHSWRGSWYGPVGPSGTTGELRRSRGLVFPDSQGKMGATAVFGRLLKDLRDRLQLAGVPQFVPVVVFAGVVPVAGGTAPGSPPAGARSSGAMPADVGHDAVDDATQRYSSAGGSHSNGATSLPSRRTTDNGDRSGASGHGLTSSCRGRRMPASRPNNRLTTDGHHDYGPTPEVVGLLNPVNGSEAL